MKNNFILFLLFLIMLGGKSEIEAQSSNGQKNTIGKKEAGTTAFTNPIIWADMPDLSITRHGSEFYLISTTMHLMPGAPVMRSKDLVHWNMASYVFDKLTDTPNYDLTGGTVYGRGQWASSIRYHNGKYYVLFSPNDKPFRPYIYTTTDPNGKWELVSRISKHFHDASLFFDDDGRVYVFYGTGELAELKADLSDVKQDGTNMKIFERDSEENGLLEGSQAFKHEGKYYLMMISSPRTGRREVCYRADKITGPWEKKVILKDNFATFGLVGQGCVIDDENGNWYGLMFQDRGGVGRVPLLMPCRWVDGWPMLGDENGHIPLTGEVPLKTYDTGKWMIGSDDFSVKQLNKLWQWNHNPVDNAWSLTERKGYLRLKTNRIVDNIYAAPNTITQRMEGPKCSGAVSIDISKMKDGDVAGFSAFNGHSALLSVIMDGNRKYLTMSTNVVNLDNPAGKVIKGVQVEEKARIDLTKKVIYLRVDCDFNKGKDLANFFYSFDNKTWTPIGTEFKMRFDYQKLFMGTKFAIFNYATKELGGYIDVDFFKYVKI